MNRRQLLSSTCTLLATSLTTLGRHSSAEPATNHSPAFLAAWHTPTLAPIHASSDRIIAMNICTRPFRALGPRQELEKVGRKTIIHNYGHGGSGWSLSWGSAALAVNMAHSTGHQQLAVIGCGAIGLTTALVAQRAGYQVSIYAKDLPPQVRSAYATGIWSPDSRICTQQHASGFANSWEQQARTSWQMYQNLLGLAGNPVEWRDMYQLSDDPFGTTSSSEQHEPEYPEFAKLLLNDLHQIPRDLDPGSHPFPVAYARYAPLLHFNITGYSKMLLDEFYQAGGKLEVTSFSNLKDMTAVPERTIINCTGYGARELLDDESITPVRGQTAKLIPQPEVNYGIRYSSKSVYVYPRRDGLLVQAGADDDFGNPLAQINPQESTSAVARLGALMQEITHNQRRNQSA